MPAWVRPSLTDFKTFFQRDFNFADPANQKDLTVLIDADLTKAMDEAEANFTPGIFQKSTSTNAFMYLAAFNLVQNIQNSTRGLQSQSNFPISAKAAGPVNVTYQIPERYLKDPYIAMLAMNGYGLKYLSMALPVLKGNVIVVSGTKPF